MKHKTDGFSAALLLAQEFGKMIDQDNENRTSTYEFHQSKEIFVFNHVAKEITIKGGKIETRRDN